jgi:hypothetical protein
MTAPNPPADLIERLRLHRSWRDSHGELNDAPNEAATALEEMLEALDPFVRSVEGWEDEMFPAYIATEQEPCTASAFDLRLEDIQRARATIAKVRGNA